MMSTGAAFTLGIDIGGTTIRAGVVRAADGRLCAPVLRIPTPQEGEPALLREALARLRVQLAGAGLTWGAVGVAIPGLLDADRARLVRAVNLPKLEGVALHPLLEAALHATPRIESDVIAAGWAQWHATGAPASRFVYLSLGTGIGGAVILDGRILRYSHHGAGSFGHLLCDAGPAAPRCRCGGRGCLEAIWRECPAQRCAALAVALVNLAHLFAPTQIVLGGGGLDHGLIELADVEAAFATRRDALIPSELTLRRAALSSDEAGVSGAARLAVQPDG